MEAAAKVRPRFGNAGGADVIEAGILGGWVAKEPANRKEICFHNISSHVGLVLSPKQDY